MYYSFFNQVTMSDRTSSDKMTGAWQRVSGSALVSISGVFYHLFHFLAHVLGLKNLDSIAVR